MYDDYEDDEYTTIPEQIENAICETDSLKFTLLVNYAHDNNVLFGVVPVCAPELLRKICKHGSYYCAIALLEGKTSLKVDLNVPSLDGYCPLHHAANYLVYDVTKLLLDHGGRTDHRCKQDLPLNAAVHAVSKNFCLNKWTPSLSIYKLIILLCLPRPRRAIRTVSLIASQTSKTQSEAMQYARNGKVVEVAILLMATARQNHPISIPLLRSIFSSQIKALALESRFACDKDKSKATILEDKTKWLVAGFHFLYVFERAHSFIPEHMNVKNRLIDIEKSISIVVRFLRQTGFVLKPEDVDLSHMSWFEQEKGLYEYTLSGMESFEANHEKHSADLNVPNVPNEPLKIVPPSSSKLTPTAGEPKNVRDVPNEPWKPIIPPSYSKLTPKNKARVEPYLSKVPLRSRLLENVGLSLRRAFRFVR